MTAPTLWWLMTFLLVALELVTGTIYALLVAIGFAVGALAAHLPRYQRSMAAYARALVEPDPAADPEADVRS